MAKKGTVRLDGVEWDFASLWGNAFCCYPEYGWHRKENQIIWSKWISYDELYKLFEEKS